MQVDMLVKRFFEELGKLYPKNRPFEMRGSYGESATSPALPPYRAMFSGSCMRSFCESYRLPHVDEFIEDFMVALRGKMAHERHGLKLKRVASTLLEEDGTPTPGLLHRLSSRYRDGIMHTHLYCVLAQAYEDQRKVGTVIMDPRVDFKMKTDITVVGLGRVVRVDIGQGSKALLASRADAERLAKRNAGGSTEKGNPFLLNPVVRVLNKGNAVRDFRGLRVFGETAVDAALREIDALLGVSEEEALSYRDMAYVRSCDLPGARG